MNVRYVFKHLSKREMEQANSILENGCYGLDCEKCLFHKHFLDCNFVDCETGLKERYKVKKYKNKIKITEKKEE